MPCEVANLFISSFCPDVESIYPTKTLRDFGGNHKLLKVSIEHLNTQHENGRQTDRCMHAHLLMKISTIHRTTQHERGRQTDRLVHACTLVNEGKHRTSYYTAWEKQTDRLVHACTLVNAQSLSLFVHLSHCLLSPSLSVSHIEVNMHICQICKIVDEFCSVKRIMHRRVIYYYCYYVANNVANRTVIFL